MTETGQILKECRRLRKQQQKEVNKVLMYAYKNNLTLKQVGLYQIPDTGYVMKDKYPTKPAQRLYDQIAYGE